MSSPIVRISKGQFDSSNEEKVRHALEQSASALVPGLKELPGLLYYHVAVDSHTKTVVNVSIWVDLASAKQMEKFGPMLAQRPIMEEAGVRFDLLTNYEPLWKIGTVTPGTFETKGCKQEEPWQLFYWPSIPGRGEFVRLILEEAKVPYIDVARIKEEEGGGVPAILRHLEGKVDGFPVFAPPFIRRGDITLSQTTNICLYLAEKYLLIPTKDPIDKYHCNQLALLIADFVLEIHDTHHPISSTLYYEDQKEEAKKITNLQ